MYNASYPANIHYSTVQCKPYLKENIWIGQKSRRGNPSRAIRCTDRFDRWKSYNSRQR